jgi:hypothetical protein
MDKLEKYNITKKINNYKYPFNAINNIKHNIIITKNEIQFEYIKNFILINPQDKKEGGIEKNITIYFY